MSKKVRFIEVLKDPELQELQKAATEALRQHLPEAGEVKLYRTQDGRRGIQVQVRLAPGRSRELREGYAAVMKVLGEARGRPPQERKVQTKLRLREPVYEALKSAARRERTTLSAVVEELAARAKLV